MNDYDTLLLGLWKIFHFSLTCSSILESFQVIHRKKPLKFLKAAVTHWLTHGRSSECVLDCLLEILAALNEICINTNESVVRGHRNLLMDHKALFFICLMADILKLLNTLSLALQTQGALLVHIKQHTIRITLEKLQKLTGVATLNHFQEVLFSANSFYAGYQKYLDILQDF